MKKHEYRPRLKAEDIEVILEALNTYIAQRLKGMDVSEVDRLACEGKLPKARGTRSRCTGKEGIQRTIQCTN